MTSTTQTSLNKSMCIFALWREDLAHRRRLICATPSLTTILVAVWLHVANPLEFRRSHERTWSSMMDRRTPSHRWQPLTMSMTVLCSREEDLPLGWTDYVRLATAFAKPAIGSGPSPCAAWRLLLMPCAFQLSILPVDSAVQY
jgi:hypothetical protein